MDRLRVRVQAVPRSWQSIASQARNPEQPSRLACTCDFGSDIHICWITLQSKFWPCKKSLERNYYPRVVMEFGKHGVPTNFSHLFNGKQHSTNSRFVLAQQFGLRDLQSYGQCHRSI